jgi:hypothetical protein
LWADSEFTVNSILTEPAYFALCPPTATGSHVEFVGLLPPLTAIGDCDRARLRLRINATSPEASTINYLINVEPTGDGECSAVTALCPAFVASAEGVDGEHTLGIILNINGANVAIVAFGVNATVAGVDFVRGFYSGGGQVEFTQLGVPLGIGQFNIYLYYAQLPVSTGTLQIQIQATDLDAIIAGVASSWDAPVPIIEAGAFNAGTFTSTSVDNGDTPCIAFDGVLIVRSNEVALTTGEIGQTTLGVAASLGTTFTLGSSWRLSAGPVSPLSWSWPDPDINFVQISGLLR